jgi:hypothetical protein
MQSTDRDPQAKPWRRPFWRRVLDRLRGLHYSVDPFTGNEYALPDEVRNAFVPTGQTSENDPSLKALAEAMAQAEQAKAEGRPWMRKVRDFTRSSVSRLVLAILRALSPAVADLGSR